MFLHIVIYVYVQFINRKWNNYEFNLWTLCTLQLRYPSINSRQRRPYSAFSHHPVRRRWLFFKFCITLTLFILINSISWNLILVLTFKFIWTCDVKSSNNTYVSFVVVIVFITWLTFKYLSVWEWKMVRHTPSFALLSLDTEWIIGLSETASQSAQTTDNQNSSFCLEDGMYSFTMEIK